MDDQYEQLAKGDLSNITTYQAGALQAAVNRSLQKCSDRVLKQFGITKMHWLVIGAVLDAGEKGIRITELAKILSTTLPYMTNVINALEKQQVVTRQEGQDNRSKTIVMDPAFAEMCPRIEKALRDALREAVYKHIDPQDFRVYMKVLHQLSKLEY